MGKNLFPLLSLYLNGWRNVQHMDIQVKGTLRATAKPGVLFEEKSRHTPLEGDILLEKRKRIQGVYTIIYKSI